MCVLPSSRMQQMPRLVIPVGAALLSGTRLIERMQKRLYATFGGGVGTNWCAFSGLHAVVTFGS